MPPELQAPTSNQVTPMTDSRAVVQEVDKTTQGLRDALDSQREILNSNATRRAAATEGLQTTISRLQPGIEQQFTEIEKALQNKEDAAALPRGVSRLIGLFDSDYNTGVQDAKINRARVSLQVLDQRLKLAKESTSVAIETANQSDTAAAGLTQVRVGEVSATQNKLVAGQQAAALNMMETKNQIESLSDADLGGAVKNLGLPAGMVQAEQQRRSQVGMALKSAALAYKAADFQFQDTVMKDYIGKLTQDELKTQIGNLDKMKPQPGGAYLIDTPFGKVSVMKQELISGLAARERADRTLLEEHVNRAGGLAAVDAMNQQTSEVLTNIAKAQPNYDKDAPAIKNLPPEMQAQLEENKQRLEQAVKNNSWTSVTKLVTEQRDMINKHIEEVAKTFDKDVQPAAKEYLTTGTLSTGNAATVTLSNMWGGNALLGTVYGDVGTMISQQIREAAKGRGLLAGLGDATASSQVLSEILNNSKTGLKGDVLIGEALNKKVPQLDAKGQPLRDASGKQIVKSAADGYMDVTYQRYLVDTFASLNKPVTSATGKPVESYYAGYLDSAGKLDDKYIKNPQALIADLTKTSLDLQKQGKLAPDANLATILVSTLQSDQNRKEFQKRLLGSFSMQELALSKVLANNNESYLMLPYIQNLKVTQGAATANAQIMDNEREQRARRYMGRNLPPEPVPGPAPSVAQQANNLSRLFQP